MENEINIKRIILVLRKRVWIILILVIFSSAIGGIYSKYITKPLYESSSRIIINAEPDNMNTLIVMINEPSFLEYVIADMNLNRTAEELSQQVSAERIAGSSIVKISVVDPNPELAAKIANSTANVYMNNIPTLLGFGEIKTFSEAKVQPQAININHEKKIILGFLVGLIAGLGLIFLLDFFDDSIRNEQDAELLLGLPVLGSVSKMKRNHLKKKAVLKGNVRRRALEINESKFLSEKK